MRNIVFVPVLSLILLTGLAFAGTPDQDAAVAHLQKRFEAAEIPSIRVLPLQTTLNCFIRSAVRDNYVMSYGTIYPVENLAGVIRVRYTLSDQTNEPEQDALLTPTSRGLVLNAAAMEIVFREIGNGELLGEASTTATFGEDKAAPAIGNPERLAIFYTVCKRN